MSRKKRLTPAIIRRLVKEERAKLNETLEMKLKHPSEAARKTREVDATKLADTLAKCMNYYQMAKLKEAKLVEELKKVQEVKRELKKRLIKNI
jgi:DNA-binding transcriptional ArsR family regulator